MDDYAWSEWERLIATRGIIIDRPKGSMHPRFPDLIYPVDYGYIPETTGGDGVEVDIFAGDAASGLAGVLLTEDSIKGDREIKLLWNLTEDEATAVGRMLNTGAMQATQIRRPVTDRSPAPGTPEAIWDGVGWLEDDLDDFTRDRHLDEIPQDRRPFEEEDEQCREVRDSG